MDVLIIFGFLILGPALVVAGIASAFARWRGKRRGESLEEIGKRIRKAFWVAFLIVVGLDVLSFGLCIAALQGIG